jgi:hypothetical protein
MLRRPNPVLFAGAGAVIRHSPRKELVRSAFVDQ